MALEVIKKKRVFNRGPSLLKSKIYIRGTVHRHRGKETYYYLFLIGTDILEKSGLIKCSKLQISFDNQNPLIKISAGNDTDFSCTSDRSRPGFAKLAVSKDYLNSLYVVKPPVETIFEVKTDGVYIKMHKKDYGQKDG